MNERPTEKKKRKRDKESDRERGKVGEMSHPIKSPLLVRH